MEANSNLVELLQGVGERLNLRPLCVGQFEIRSSGRKILNILSELEESLDDQVSATPVSYHVDDGK